MRAGSQEIWCEHRLKDLLHLCDIAPMVAAAIKTHLPPYRPVQTCDEFLSPPPLQSPLHFGVEHPLKRKVFINQYVMKNVTAEFYILVDRIANSIQQVSNINSQEYGLHFSRGDLFCLTLIVLLKFMVF